MTTLEKELVVFRKEKIVRLKAFKAAIQGSEMDFMRNDIRFKGNIVKERKLIITPKIGFFTCTALRILGEEAEKASLQFWIESADNVPTLKIM